MIPSEILLLFTPRPETYAQKPQNSGLAHSGLAHSGLGFVTQKARENTSRWRGCEKQRNLSKTQTIATG